MRLIDLIENVRARLGPEEAGALDVSVPDPGAEISGLASDSRMVTPGVVFAALPGSAADGRQYIPRATGAGAAAVLAPPGSEISLEAQGHAALIRHPRPRLVLALMAACFYGRQPENVGAVTGTNGKTSATHFLRAIWRHLGHRAAVLGTLGLTGPDGERLGGLTTPDPVALHAELAELADQGVTHLAMEASSHGLDQRRLDGVALKAAGFTNLSRDHLDYHGDMETYFAAKARLFTELLADDGVAVINMDDEWGRLLAPRSLGDVVGIGTAEGADYRITDLGDVADGLNLSFAALGRDFSVRLPVSGAFQAYNALTALAMAAGRDAKLLDQGVSALEHLQAPRGRLQAVPGHPQGAQIYVDFAHKTFAFESVLRALKPRIGLNGKLRVVFGCGGNRDTAKRPEMGALAMEWADHIIVTDDNPRFEDPAAIRRAILAACPKAEEIADRRTAIRRAIAALGPEDVLLIAGKGHETGQIIGERVEPFDDAGEVRKALSASF